MWTRAELKTRAKACLKKYYWMAFLASLIVTILGGGTAGGSGFRFGVNRVSSGGGTQSDSLAQLQETWQNFLNNMDLRSTLVVASVVGSVILVAWLVAICWDTFFVNMIRVGSCRYFMESRAKQESAGLGKLFYGFSCGHYLNVAKVMFLRGLFTFLWTLLLVIPGIIKSYEYLMVPYILAENPDINYKDALSMSKRMMQGEKWNAFVLGLSFILWELLGLLLCCIGGVFVTPYINTTFAELYAVLRTKVSGDGVHLNGFGEPQAEEVYQEYVEPDQNQPM